MTFTLRSGAVLAGATGLVLLAACKPVTTQDRGGNEAAPNSASNQSIPGGLTNMSAGNMAEPDESRSILRPEVVAPKPEAPAIEPVHAVIPFGAAGLKLDDAARAAVDTLLEAPVMKAGGPIVLRGHTDSRGSDGDNLVASRIRAERVRDYLVERGVEKQRVTVIALGETRPEVPNAHEDGTDDPEGRAKNRRVEVSIDIPKAPDSAPISLPKPASPPTGS